MNIKTFLQPAILLFLIYPMHADSVSRRATITGGRGPGRCTIEVNVDHAAEVEILGDTANLRTVGGQPAYWRRFECNAPVPHRPQDFRVAKVNGRGKVQLLRDPRNNRGTAVIHITDPQRGRGVYAVDVVWQAGGWGSAPPPPPQSPGSGGAIRNAVRTCQEAVIDRLNRDGYQYVTFGRTAPDSNSGPNDWISGVATGKRGGETRHFSFSCSMDFRSGAVRFVDVRRR